MLAAAAAAQADVAIKEFSIATAAGATGETVDGLRRLVAKLQPEWIFMENVPRLVKGQFEASDEGDLETAFSQNGPALIKVFSAIGYDLKWVFLSPHELGVPQHRCRAFVAALRSDTPDAQGKLDRFPWQLITVDCGLVGRGLLNRKLL